jgi:hypothetical protein
MHPLLPSTLAWPFAVHAVWDIGVQPGAFGLLVQAAYFCIVSCSLVLASAAAFSSSSIRRLFCSASEDLFGGQFFPFVWVPVHVV